MNTTEDEVENEEDVEGDESTAHDNEAESQSRPPFAFPPELFIKSKIEEEPDPAYDEGINSKYEF